MALSAYLTSAGYELLNRLIASQGTLHITKAELGSGVCSGEDACRARTSLVKRVCDASLTKVSFEGGEAKITVQYLNSGLATGFFVNEVGIYAKHPTTGAPITSPYVSMAREYSKHANALWNQIYAVDRENSSMDCSTSWTPADDVMERLLTMRRST